MDKKRDKKVIIIIIIITTVLILSLLAYFIFFKPSMFNFLGFDFSSSSKLYDVIGKTGNAFEGIKLNPFANSSA